MEIPDFEKILYPGHPAVDVTRALFQFIVSDEKTGLIHSLVSVDTADLWEIVTLERILLQGTSVSRNCRLVSIVRDHRMVGVRDDSMNELAFPDFMSRHVDFGRVARDNIALGCAKMAMSKLDFNKFCKTSSDTIMSVDSAKARSIDYAVSNGMEKKPHQKSILDVGMEKKNKDLFNALLALGFKRNDVSSYVNTVHDRVMIESLDVLLRDGIKKLRA